MCKRFRVKSDHQRTAIANEAARIIQEQGLTDFRIAKAKATERLGFRSGGPLPSNEEIENALAERIRIFRGTSHNENLQALRSAALNLMRALENYQPRLVGPVLSGNSTEHTMIDLHLFNDAAEEVGSCLCDMGIRYRLVERRQRLRRNLVEHFPGYRFFFSEFECTSTVFPERHRHHAPLSPVDGRPMRRAGSREISLLVENTPPV